jgi:type IV pilus assembly protein PilO
MKVGFETKGLARKIEKIPAIYKTIIVLVIAIVLLLCFIYFLAKPQWETREQLQKEYSGLRNELNNLKTIQNNLEKHRQEYQLMQEKLQDVLKQLPETKDIPNLLRNITSVGEETRLKIKYFEPKGIKHKDFYCELPFEIKFSGPFHNTASFFDDVRRMDRLVNITSFALEAKGTPKNVVLEGSCSANAYVYQKDRPTVQKRMIKRQGESDQTDNE